MDSLRTNTLLNAKTSKGKIHAACLLDIQASLHIKTTLWRGHYSAQRQH